MSSFESFVRSTPDAGLQRELLALLEPSSEEAAILVLDEHRRVIRWNEQAERLLDRDADALRGRFCAQIIGRQECLTACDLEVRRAAPRAVTLHRRDGTALQARALTRPLRDADGRTLGAVELLFPEHPPASDTFGELTSSAPALRLLFRTADRVARTSLPAVLLGEPGSGRRALARAMHARSTRADGPLVERSCAALTGPDAPAQLRAALEAARDGTLLLSELSELSSPLQALLAVALPEPGRPDASARVLATSAEDPATCAGFRQELQLRLGVVLLHLPPLRDTPEELLPELDRQLAAHAARLGRPTPRFDEEALVRLRRHPWPGNRAELSNVVLRALLFSEADLLTGAALPADLGAVPSSEDEVERLAARRALERHGADLAAAAAELGISRTTLWRRRRRYGL